MKNLKPEDCRNFCACVRPNPQGRYPFKELLELLVGADEAAALSSATLA
jgi:hypothetical protein